MIGGGTIHMFYYVNTGSGGLDRIWDEELEGLL